jgi:beta-fructofuranosidase
LIDRSILEVFVGGGVDSVTTTFFPTQPLTLFALSTADLPEGVTVSIVVRAVNSAWATEEDSQGVVIGNVTTPGPM